MAYDIQARCKFCDRYIPVQVETSSSIRVRCADRKCKQWNDIKVTMMSDAYKGSEHTHTVAEPNMTLVTELKKQALKLDGRTKEAKNLNAKIADMEKYIASLEGIIDGQG